MSAITGNCFKKEGLQMTWTNLWLHLFGTTSWLGLNLGFWVATAAVLLLVLLMNVVFWALPPRTNPAAHK